MHTKSYVRKNDPPDQLSQQHPPNSNSKAAPSSAPFHRLHFVDVRHSICLLPHTDANNRTTSCPIRASPYASSSATCALKLHPVATDSHRSAAFCLSRTPRVHSTVQHFVRRCRLSAKTRRKTSPSRRERQNHSASVIWCASGQTTRWLFAQRALLHKGSLAVHSDLEGPPATNNSNNFKSYATACQVADL